MRAVLLAVLLTGPVAFAAPKKSHRSVPKPAPATGGNVVVPVEDNTVALAPGGQHSEGAYGGVTPGVAPNADGKKPKRPPAKGTLSWIGFEAKSGNAEIFLQSVAPFAVNQHVDNGALVVDLGGLDKLGQNTWREVDARFFDTPVARITAKHVGAARGKNAHAAGLEVRITFKNPKDTHEAAVRSANEADGMYYQYLSFAGSGGGTVTPSDPSPEK
ncbi:MAG: hypothetical protein ABI591_08715 [Kofleriaceae bacterium]